ESRRDAARPRACRGCVVGAVACSHLRMLSLRSEMFFFSSRRRHTRSKRDWSSDVCSSDLLSIDLLLPTPRANRLIIDALACVLEIGRASCRERVYNSVDTGGAQKKK